MPQPDRVVAAVARHTGISVDVLTARGPGYGRRVIYARHVCWWLLRHQKPRVPLRAITALFGNHHTTIINGVCRIDRELRYGNDDTRADVAALEEALREALEEA